MAYAAENTYDNNGLAPPSAMKINLIVNAKGKVCLLHDEPFSATPIWVKYNQNQHVVDILFDNGTTHQAIRNVPPNIDSYLVNSNRVMIILIEDRKPVEGWETILLNELN